MSHKCVWCIFFQTDGTTSITPCFFEVVGLLPVNLPLVVIFNNEFVLKFLIFKCTIICPFINLLWRLVILWIILSLKLWHTRRPNMRCSIFTKFESVNRDSANTNHPNTACDYDKYNQQNVEQCVFPFTNHTVLADVVQFKL